MKRFILVLILMPMFGQNFLFAESHEIKMEDQVKKFENAVGLVGEKKYVEAVEEFKILADLGLPEAQFNLAVLNLNGLGAPKNFKNALYWSWYAYLNKHETAYSQAEEIFPSITEALRDEVATQITDELLALANDGDQRAALKLGQTYTQLFVTPDYKSAYVWLSIAQAYGLEEGTELLENATKQLTLEEVLQQQNESATTFDKIKG